MTESKYFSVTNNMKSGSGPAASEKDVVVGGDLDDGEIRPSAFKRMKIEICSLNDSTVSECLPPLLSPQEQITPDFGLSDAWAAYPLPILHPETYSPTSPSRSISTSTTSIATNQAQAKTCRNKSRSIQQEEIIQFKKINRIAKVDSRGNELNEKLKTTILAFKGQENDSAQKCKPLVRTPKSAMVSRNSIQPKQLSKKTHRQNDRVVALETRFAANPNPTASQIFELSVETLFSVADVKKYLNAYKRKTGTTRVNLPSTDNHTYLGGESSTLNQSVQRPGQGKSATVTGGEDSRTRQIKYIKNPSLRTQDIEVIKNDIKNIEKCPVEGLKKILKLWELKAFRILKLSIHKRFQLKETIYKEARRIKDIASTVNPFTPEQESEVNSWKERFMNEAATRVKDSTIVKHVVNEAIMPWIVPFVYSKTATQDGRLLSLEVALCDFCKISNSNSGNEWEWKVPAHLQYDL